VPSLDTVVANAGFGVAGSAEALTIADFQRQFETNVFGVLRTLHATLPLLKKSRGKFAVMGSATAYVALPGNSAYAMSKHAVRALAESLRYELHPYGVSVTHLVPGFIASQIRRVDNYGAFREAARDPIPHWLICPADRAAKAMVRAVENRKREQAITWHGWCAASLARHFPGLFHFLISSLGVSGRPQPSGRISHL
jgi:short-subunit dehydrogenase